MKLLFYCDTVFGYGGVERVLAELSKALSKSHEVTVLSTDMRKDYAMYGYDRSQVKFRFIEYGKAPRLENLICKGVFGECFFVFAVVHSCTVFALSK